MIHINDPKECCGCSACAQRCPKQCITMLPDSEGFLYPVIDSQSCIDCGICEKVCPIINQAEPKEPLKAYAAYNKDEQIRLKSSSGGIFTLLAQGTIEQGGVVFGVRFNEQWQPIFDYTETIEGIAPFRGSKYVQATVGNAYIQAETFLKAGRQVLFSGTPCQIAGLRRYLRKEYDNLLTVDIICHGVPSPKVWSMYLDEMSTRYRKRGHERANIESISFRDKSQGWKSFRMAIQFSNSKLKKDNQIYSKTFYRDNYLRTFVSDTTLRPSCYSCPANQGKSHSDITIADFWGIDTIDPTFDDDKGCGAILINSDKGARTFPHASCVEREKPFRDIVNNNTSWHTSSTRPAKREEFFATLEHTQSVIKSVQKQLIPSRSRRIAGYIKRRIKSLQRRINNIITPAK
ncbi:MAG: Coenzyme F420 hydrogenase/dehydrogenase, beta subunit C-terminal domain [Bacteroidaceae bacterium]|nr:Coenzyme F420 hydrogenase/dehydrogenase, beta subunit C-terminal domain [Bacteroidaceae bacterium]